MDYNLAGLSAFAAIGALLLAGIFFFLFLRKGGIYGPLNDLSSAAGLLLLILPALAIEEMAVDLAGGWFRWVTIAAIAGMILAAAGQVLLVLRVIPLGASFVTGGIGVMPVMAWMAWQGYTGLRYGIPATAVGVLAIAVLVLSAVLALVSTKGPRAVAWVSGNLLIMALAGYLASLGTVLLRQG